MSDSYAPPVDQLLTIGKASLGDWPNYLALGLQDEHVPELIRMATDEALARSGSESTEVWAGIHAWRTLGQLHAEAAIEPLGERLAESKLDDDWELEELPKVLAMLGRPAIPMFVKLLDDSQRELWPRSAAVEGLTKIALDHPQTRNEIVGLFMHRLENFESEDEYIVTSFVDSLVNLHATEAAPLIEQAFAADKVDISMRGDWEDIQIDLGLLDERKTPQPDYMARWRSAGAPPQVAPRRDQKSNDKARAKAKRKAAKESRKRNRKRK